MNSSSICKSTVIMKKGFPPKSLDQRTKSVLACKISSAALVNPVKMHSYFGLGLIQNISYTCEMQLHKMLQAEDQSECWTVLTAM